MILASTKRRILQFLDHKNIKRSEFYAITGIKRGLLDADKLDAMVSDQALKAIIEVFPELDPEWLITGGGNMLRRALYTIPEAKLSMVRDATGNYVCDGDHNSVVPLYRLDALEQLASIFSDDPSETLIDYISIPFTGDCDGAVRLSILALSPLIDAGDIIMFKRVGKQAGNILWGGLYLVYFKSAGQQRLMLGYLHRSEREGYLKLIYKAGAGISDNISPSDVIAIARIVMGIRYWV